MRIVVAPLASRFNHPYSALYGYIIEGHHVQHTAAVSTELATVVHYLACRILQ
jgi:hypothetical protein